MLGGFLVVAFAAGATTTSVLLKVEDYVHLINHTKALHVSDLTLPQPGKPETLLLVGSDHRYGDGSGESNTDTMMLVRIDDSSSTINMLSIPRDLAVTIGGQTVKLNSAWSTGGPKLLIQVLRQQVFPDLKVNHILNIDFSGFAGLINAIGCVYSMVDHRYYNTNVGTLATDFSNIDIQPGYQPLCGGRHNDGGATSALAFVRFRHTDTDLLRETRQQDFLRWAKSQFSDAELVGNEQKLIHIFAYHVSSDSFLHSTNGLLDLFDLAVNANGHAIRSFQFPVSGFPTINGGDYVASTLPLTEAIYKQFITPTPVSAPKPKRPARHHRHRATTLKIPASMTADSGDGRRQAAQLGPTGIPVYYPRYIPSTFGYCYSTTANCDDPVEPQSAYTGSYPRRYTIRDHDGQRFPSYVFTLGVLTGGQVNLDLGQYINVQGTAWQDPPILRAKPTLTQTINGRKLLEYYNGAHNLTLVAWRTKSAVYWISNTLQDNLPASQMVAMAATLTPAGR